MRRIATPKEVLGKMLIDNAVRKMIQFYPVYKSVDEFDRAMYEVDPDRDDLTLEACIELQLGRLLDMAKHEFMPEDRRDANIHYHYLRGAYAQDGWEIDDSGLYDKVYRA